MVHKVTMRVVASLQAGPLIGSHTPVHYEVRGLPEYQLAWIAKFQAHWRILRASDRSHGVWAGSFGSPHEALAALQRELDEPATEVAASRE